jgi:hypothetical protein
MAGMELWHVASDGTAKLFCPPGPLCVGPTCKGAGSAADRSPLRVLQACTRMALVEPHLQPHRNAETHHVVRHGRALICARAENYLTSPLSSVRTLFRVAPFSTEQTDAAVAAAANSF